MLGYSRDELSLLLTELTSFCNDNLNLLCNISIAKTIYPSIFWKRNATNKEENPWSR